MKLRVVSLGDGTFTIRARLADCRIVKEGRAMASDLALYHPVHPLWPDNMTDRTLAVNECSQVERPRPLHRPLRLTAPRRWRN
jgi:hypothetical protein